jgi:elongation factor P
MIIATQLRKGMLISLDGKLYQAHEVLHHKGAGRGGGMVSTRLRDVENGPLIDRKFRPSETIEKVRLDEKSMEFLYEEGDNYIFSDLKTYEEITLTKDQIGDAVDYMTHNMQISVEFFKERPVGVELPRIVELKIVETQPQLRGATVSNVNKPAKLETGATVLVPPFVEEGETIKVDTETGEYMGRV